MQSVHTLCARIGIKLVNQNPRLIVFPTELDLIQPLLFTNGVILESFRVSERVGILHMVAMYSRNVRKTGGKHYFILIVASSESC